MRGRHNPWSITFTVNNEVSDAVDMIIITVIFDLSNNQ